MNQKTKKYVSNKTFVIIPGFGEFGSEPWYKSLKSKIEVKGFNVHIVKINWKYGVMSKYISEAEASVKKLTNGKADAVILFGFSFGAFIALQLSRRTVFKKIISASCSPYYNDILKDIPKPAHDFWGIRRMNDFKKYNIGDLKNSESKKFSFFFGDKDWVSGIEISKKLSKLTGGKFVLLKDTEHFLSENYIAQIAKEIG